jgi:hypothetical protein
MRFPACALREVVLEIEIARRRFRDAPRGLSGEHRAAEIGVRTTPVALMTTRGAGARSASAFCATSRAKSTAEGVRPSPLPGLNSCAQPLELFA